MPRRRLGVVGEQAQSFIHGFHTDDRAQRACWRPCARFWSGLKLRNIPPASGRDPVKRTLGASSAWLHCRHSFFTARPRAEGLKATTRAPAPSLSSPAARPPL